MTSRLRRKRQITVALTAPPARANVAPVGSVTAASVLVGNRRRHVWHAALVAATVVAAAWTAGPAHADGGPAPLFLSPRSTSGIASGTSDVEQASRERLKERAAAVSNPNLKWKPYRPAPKADEAPTVTTQEETVKPAAKKSAAGSTRKKRSTASNARRASRIATDANPETDVDVVADAEPAGRTASPSSRSQLRSEILQVDQREKADPFSDPLESEPTPAEMDRSPSPRAPGADMDTPRTIDPREDSFPDDTLPAPSEIGGGNYTSSSPGAAEAIGCDTEKSECATALRRLKSTTIDKININIAIAGREGTDFPCECELEGVFTDRNWQSTLFTWKASSLCHKPLYFEEVGLERYGHSLNPFWQPIFSGVHFFATIPILPYMMGVYPPNECQYVLGYYRMGDCAPYMVPPFPFSVRGAFFETVAVVCPILIVH